MAGVQSDRSGVVGSEYQAPPDLLGILNDRNVPCAACYTPEREVKIMIPGRISCMPSWTREYYGYLMAEKQDHHRNSFECVDVDAEALAIGASAIDRNGSLFYHAEARECQGTRCLPYTEGHEITCVVCTK